MASPNYAFTDLTRQTADVPALINDNYRISEISGCPGVVSRTGGVPGAPVNGEIYIVDATTGIWAGATIDDIAQLENAVWTFTTPKIGFYKAWVIDDDEGVVFNASGWVNDASTSLGAALNLDGEVLIGSTAGSPVGATLTAGEAIDITNASNSITILCEDATDSNKGVSELATDAETVTGTSTVLVTTPANITAKMSAPGPIGDTTPAAIDGTTIDATSTITTSAKVTTGEFLANVPDNNALAFAFLEGANIIFAASTVNGSESVVFGNTTTNPLYFLLGSGTVTSGGAFHGPAGSVSAPTHSTSTDTDTGGYFPNDSEYGITVAGVGRIVVSTASFASTLPILFPSGSATAPGIAPSVKTNTGLYLIGGNDFGFTSNGALAMVIDQGQKIAIGSSAGTARVDITQPVVAGGVPVLDLEQLDIDDTFINLIGTSAADGSRSLSSDTGELGAVVAKARIEYNGVVGWMRIYADET